MTFLSINKASLGSNCCCVCELSFVDSLIIVDNNYGSKYLSEIGFYKLFIYGVHVGLPNHSFCESCTIE